MLFFCPLSLLKLKRVDQYIKLAFKSRILIYRKLHPGRLLIKVLYGGGGGPALRSNPLCTPFTYLSLENGSWKKHQELQPYHYLRVAAPSPWQRKKKEGSFFSLFFLCRGKGVATHRLSFHISQLVNPLPFHKPEAWKTYPLPGRAPS